MSQNLMRLLRADAGYEPANLLKIELGFPAPRYNDPARRVRTIDQVLQSIETLPGVVAAGITTLQPIPRTTANELIAITLERPSDSAVPLLTTNNRIVTPTSVSLMVRTASATPTLLNQIREAVRAIDSTLPLYDATSMQNALAQPLSNQCLGTIMFVGFGAFGLFLAALGTYGVIASSVNQRRTEFGIRAAIGALPRDLLRLVLGEGLRVVLVGLLLGMACAWMLSRLLGVVTTEVNIHDPLTFIVAAVVLSLAGAVACWIPARRASRAEPMIALRAE